MPSSQRQINGTAAKVLQIITLCISISNFIGIFYFINIKKPSNRELSINVLNAMRLRYNGRSSMQQTELETAQYSMELMRQNVQHLFDKEIQIVVRKYVEVNF